MNEHNWTLSDLYREGRTEYQRPDGLMVAFGRVAYGIFVQVWNPDVCDCYGDDLIVNLYEEFDAKADIVTAFEQWVLLE